MSVVSQTTSPSILEELTQVVAAQDEAKVHPQPIEERVRPHLAVMLTAARTSDDVLERKGLEGDALDVELRHDPNSS